MIRGLFVSLDELMQGEEIEMDVCTTSGSVKDVLLASQIRMGEPAWPRRMTSCMKAFTQDVLAFSLVEPCKRMSRSLPCTYS